MKQFALLFGLLISNIVGFSQAISGTVVDRHTREPLAFASLVCDGNNQRTILSDVDGRFTIPWTDVRSIQCSFIGYATVVVTDPEPGSLILALEPTPNALPEVTVHPGANRANQIMRRVIAGKRQNNPENLNAFSYKCYNKVTFDFLYNKNRRDSLAISEKIGNSRLLLMESVTQRKFKKPNLSEEVILATRVSGFQKPGFASLATDLQPLSFYQDNISLFGVAYLNPVADGSLSKYHFVLQEEQIRAKDTLFVLTFSPKPNKNFDALQGILYVSSNRYAIQNVIAEPHQKAKINIKIQQQYQLLHGNRWFPEQLSYTVTADGYPNPNIGLYSEGKSYLRDVEINPALPQKEFGKWSVRIDPEAMAKDSLFWTSERPLPLTRIDELTYKTIDSLGKAENFDRYLSLSEKLIQGKIPLSFVDIDLSKTIVYNKYEGFRLGTGFFTNEQLSTNTTLGGFFGYGLKDRDWKFGGQFDYWLSTETSIGVSCEQNLVEWGASGLMRYTSNPYNLRNLIGYRYDRIRQVDVNFKAAPLRYLHIQLNAARTDIAPQYDYTFQTPTGSYRHYATTTIAIHLRYAFGEQKISSFGTTFNRNADYPVLQLLVKKSFKNRLGGDFNFRRVEFSADQSFYTKNIGLSQYRLHLGYIDPTLPIGQLFTGQGAHDDEMALVVKNHFQTMRPYEFVSDRFAHLFFTHNFGRLLLHSPYFSPDISVLHNAGWGQLSDATAHRHIDFKTQEKTYLECGLRLENLIRVNYMNLGYLGLGAAGFYRYGAYAFADANDNFALKLALTFSIR